MPNLLRQASGHGRALVGDAGYFRDAVTGHGMTDAMRDAELLARAVDLGLRSQCLGVALAEYQAVRDRMVADLFDLTVRLAHYPAVPVFAELQRDFGRRVGREAEELAAWPDLLEPEGVLMS
jgi:2-polyprenyl-6-methoxyphenol hydroxylase-like FAD-dependent oxidoreductase